MIRQECVGLTLYIRGNSHPQNYSEPLYRTGNRPYGPCPRHNQISTLSLFMITTTIRRLYNDSLLLVLRCLINIIIKSHNNDCNGMAKLVPIETVLAKMTETTDTKSITTSLKNTIEIRLNRHDRTVSTTQCTIVRTID